MRTTLITLLLTGIAAATCTTPARAAPKAFCKTAYCVTLPNIQERLELLAYVADRSGAKISLSPIVCSTLSGSHRAGCAVLQGLVADARRAATYDALAKGWTPESRAAFARLLAAEEAFARAVGDNETDHMSAESSADAIMAQQAEKDAFLVTVKKIAGGKARRSLVDFGPVGVPSADSALNAAYAQVMAVRDTSDLAWGSIETGGIRQTQRAWLVYRDAFVAFAATLGPDAADAVEVEITTRRVVSLEGFLED